MRINNKVKVFGEGLWKKFDAPLTGTGKEIKVLGKDVFDKLDTPPSDVWGKLAEPVPVQPYRQKTQGDIWAGN